MFCTSCGSKVPDDAKFCEKCGMPIEKAFDNQKKVNMAQMPVISEYEGIKANEAGCLETEKAVKKRKKIIAITILIVCACIAFVILLFTVIISNSNYNSAGLGQKYKSADVGDIITFGTYEQDNNTSNGKEDIEWLVLAKEDNRILVISDKALDCQPYNTLDTII